MTSTSIRKLLDRSHLSRDEMRGVIADVIDGQVSDIQKSALLVALRMKGETPEEILGAALAMRERVTPIENCGDDLVDTCGTGGDGSGTFNVSTAAALVAAGAGARVAKHGNRAVSSSCGSADVLAALGVRIDLDASQMAGVLRAIGMAFLFAPKLHPAMAAVVLVRRELGVRTIFNLLGPLTNPAFARRQVLGVFDRRLVGRIGAVLEGLDTEHAMVVHSDDGLDEISVSAATTVCEVRNGLRSTYRVTPEDFGLQRRERDEVRGGAATENAAIIREVLDGRRGAARDIVVVNAAAALYVGGRVSALGEGARMAEESIDSGRAGVALEELIRATNEFGAAA
ncbi:MAG: anthranilate phosphoribosyltransferase [Thermoanaerobaculia bacterium]